MQISDSQLLESKSVPATSDCVSGITTYDDILKEYDLPYKSIEFYWQVGEIKIKEGWVLHLSVVRQQIPKLLRLLLPTILSNNVGFKVVRDSQLADYMLEGRLGTDFLCKILSIYPTSNAQALQLAKDIVPLTKGCKGPTIPMTQFLSGILYAQFIISNPHKQNKKNRKNEWPFGELKSVIDPHRQKLLNQKYYTISVIKPDARGNVTKALFFLKPWKIGSCIIKQGRKFMNFDDAERDIQDRLLWQFELHEKLAKFISLPKAIDFFKEGDDAYLVLEFIRGISMSSLIQNLYVESKWNIFATKNKLLITSHLLTIVKMIHCLHENGFVHRDITPENIFIDNRQHLWLLDVELMWSLDSKEHSAPFQLGTAGFMSPEQQSSMTPTIKEDIYALGAFVLFVFTNLHPLKFADMSSDQLKATLSFLIGNHRLVNLISECLARNPIDRPDIEASKTELELHLVELQQKESVNLPHLEPRLSDCKLRQTVQFAIQGLSDPRFLNHQQCWISNLAGPEYKETNPPFGAIVYPGWHTGLAGPLWLIAIAKKNNFDIGNCLGSYHASWNYILRNYAAFSTDASLYSGTAGMAFALSAGYDSQLLAPHHGRFQIEKLMKDNNFNPNLSSGVAGQGIALLKVRRWVDVSYSQERLNSYVHFLLNNHGSNGSWQLDSPNKKERTELTLSNGIPGIIWFLMNYYDAYPDDNVLNSIIKACNWLIQNGYHKSKNEWGWPMIHNSRSDTAFSTNRGIPGLILVLIKAFVVTRDSRYRDVAIASLKNLPDHPHYDNFTLGDGLAGLGELYLEAYNAFEEPLWLQRASWIAQLFILTFQSGTFSGGYWVIEGEKSLTADLFNGNSGVIHFLMRFLLPEKLRHPLCG